MPHIGNEPDGAKFLRFSPLSAYTSRIYSCHPCVKSWMQCSLSDACPTSEHGVCDHANHPLTSGDEAREQSFVVIVVRRAMTGGVHDQSRGVSIARGPLQSPRGHLFRPSHRGKVAATGRLLSGVGRPAVPAISPH